MYYGLGWVRTRKSPDWKGSGRVREGYGKGPGMVREGYRKGMISKGSGKGL